MQVLKSVKQNYSPTPEIFQLLETFRCMVNECIRIGLQENITSMKSLSLKAYHQLDRYDVYTAYRLTAISKATGILNNYRKALKKNPNVRQPFARKPTLVACYGLKIRNGKLRLPIRANECVYVPLNQHVQRVISSHTLRSASFIARNMSIAFSKETDEIEPTGYIGIDRNLNNVTTATTNQTVKQYDLSKVTEIKSKYRQVQRRLKRTDHRIRRDVFQKYGRLQRDKVQQILHHASKMIVQQAKRNQLGIVMERVTGMRKLYQKGNWQGKRYRGRMNGWSYAELQRQVEYKAKWEGMSVIYVNPSGTSVKCSKCGSRLKPCKPEENRTLTCPSCGFTVDRDVNAALNIAARGLRFRPVGSAGEAMMQERAGVAPILKVDADQLTAGAQT